MKVIIREYQSEDYTQLIELLNKVYNSEIDQITLENKYLSDYRSILIATDNDNNVLGCTFTEIQEDFVRPNRILYVTYVAVDEKYRKNGIGRMLMNEAENFCKRYECSAIELTSANFRVEAHSFYESLGFTKKKTTLFIKEV